MAEAGMFSANMSGGKTDDGKPDKSVFGRNTCAMHLVSFDAEKRDGADAAATLVPLAKALDASFEGF